MAKVQIAIMFREERFAWLLEQKNKYHQKNLSETVETTFRQLENFVDEIRRLREYKRIADVELNKTPENPTGTRQKLINPMVNP